MIEQMAVHLKQEFPEMTRFSRRNLYAIRQWYPLYCSAHECVPQPVAHIPRVQDRPIISKVKDLHGALFYSVEILNQGWGRDVLGIQIGSTLYGRKGKAVNNFAETLSSDQSKMAIET